MEWKKFTESQMEFPEVIIEKMILGFTKATGGLVELNILELNEFHRSISKIDGNFQFNLFLSSAFVNEYKLKILTLGYDVELTPINLLVEDTIYEEIFMRSRPYNGYEVFENDETFVQIIQNIFQSKRFNELVSGLMKVAKKNSQKGF